MGRGREGWQVTLRTGAEWHMRPKNKTGNRKPGEKRSSEELRETGGQALGLGGWTARQILEAAAELATEVERGIQEALTEGAWALGKKNAPPLSRRKMNGSLP